MEESPPGGDYASGEGDPSISDNPPAIRATNPGGEQGQSKSVSSGDDVSQAASQSPELEKKKVSSTTSGEHASSTLQGTTFDEKSLLSQSVHSFDHKQCAMLFRRYVSRTAAGRGRAVLEGVGLLQEDIQMCFSKSLQNEEEAIQFGLMKWRDGSGDSTTWAVLIEAMKYAQIGVQHIEPMKDELLKGLPSAPLPQSVSAEGSQRVSMMGASTVSTSGMAMAVNTSPDVSVLSLESLKMDILSCDVNVFESQKHPVDAIRSFYFNAYNHLIRILSTQCSAIKSVALSAARTKQVSATEVMVKEACDLRALFECLEVDKKWNDLEFLSIAITSLPVEASKEKGAAQLVLGHYKSYLTHYMKAVSIKEGKSALSFLQRQRGREERMIVSEITVDKEIDEYTCYDLLDLWKLFLIETLEIPEGRIEFRRARSGNSTTLVFIVTQTYTEGIKKKLSKPAAVWLMKELGILRVYVTGVVNVDLREVLLNVLIASIREGLKSGVDFVSLTKVSPPLMCSLVDRVPEPKETQPGSIQPYSAGPAELSLQEPAVDVSPPLMYSLMHRVQELKETQLGMVQPYSAGPGEQSVPEPVVEATSSASVIKDLLVAAAEGRLHEVQSLLDGGRCRVNDENEEGYTAILIAAVYGHLTVLRTLVEQYGGNLLHREKGGRNAFHLACAGGHLAVAEYLAPKMVGHLFYSDDDGYTALHWAAQEGQLSVVEYLVRSCGFGVKAVDKWGYTPLLSAAHGGHAEIANFLLARGSNVQEQNNDGWTALLLAARNGHRSLVQELCESFGAKFLHRKKDGCNAFDVCAIGGHLAVAEYLAPKMEGHLFDSDYAGYTALHWAAQEGQLPMVEYLVRSCGFDVKARNKWGYTPLLRAVVTGHTDIAHFLLASGSDFYERNSGGLNAFHLSAACGHVGVAQYLVPKMGDQVFDLTDAKDTALHIAAENGYLSMVEHLVKSAGFDVEDKNKYGETPFLTAAAMGHVEVAGFLLDNGSSILERTHDGFNAFHLSAEGGHVGVAQYLAPKMKDHIFDLTDEKDTALHWAAMNGHLPMVEHLIKSAGFDVKDRNKYGETPFLTAVAMGHVEVATFLLDNGSSILEQADDGFNAFHLSAVGGHVGVAQYLAPMMGVHMFDLTDAKDTALHIAAMNGHLPMVEHLVKSAGFNVKAKNKYGQTPFLAAAARGHVEVAGFLLDNGSSILERTDHGESALQIAVREGHLDMVKVLVQAYRDCHMESEIGQYYMDLAYDYGHGHVVGYLSSEFPFLKRKVSVVSQPVSKVPVPQPRPTRYPNVWSISGPTYNYPDY